MRHEADEFEHALQASSRGDPVEGPLASLVETAQAVRKLSGNLPAPPKRLVPGRQRFLAEAARRREALVRGQARPAWALRLAAALGAVTILLGALLGVERAAAASLPGDPLYGVKLAGEQVRLALALRPTARFALTQAMAEERMDEILALLGANRGIDASVSRRTAQQLGQALATAAHLGDSSAPLALQELAEAISQRETAMRLEAGEAPQPLQELLREMERVREEAHRGQGDPEGLRRRLRYGAPTEPTDLPRATPASGQSPTRTRVGPSPGIGPGPSQTPQRTSQPSASPGASGTPASTAGASMTPQPTGQPPGTHTPVRTATTQPPEPPHASATPVPGGTDTPNPDPGGTPVHTPGSGGGGGRP